MSVSNRDKLKSWGGPATVATGLIALIFTFQNCSQGYSSQHVQKVDQTSSSSSSTPLPGPNDPLSASAIDSSAVANLILAAEIRLNKVDAADVVINYSTVNGSALAGVHFSFTTGSVTIPAGQLSVQVNIPLLKSETNAINFGLKIDSVSNGDVGRQMSVLTIPGGSVVPLVVLENKWKSMTTSGAPAPRARHTVTGIGSKVFVFGGNFSNGAAVTTFNDGNIYDPATDTWKQVSQIGAPTRRAEHTAVWTGSKVIVWGGSSGANDGALYDPATDTWTATSLAGAPAARVDASAVWTGNKMIIFGGTGAGTTYPAGGQYDPANNTWAGLSAVGAPAGRIGHAALWTGTKMIIWGGNSAANGSFNSGSIYDPAANAWSPISQVGAPSARYYFSAVWTGTKMIVWGGIEYTLVNGSPVYIYHNDGAIYDLATNTWSAMNSTGAPSARAYSTTVWTGTKMIVWSGGPQNPTEGAIYDPANDTWVAMNTAGAPLPRYNYSPDAAWVNSSMVVFGGHPYNSTSTYTNTGGIFY